MATTWQTVATGDVEDCRREHIQAGRPRRNPSLFPEHHSVDRSLSQTGPPPAAGGGIGQMADVRLPGMAAR